MKIYMLTKEHKGKSRVIAVTHEPINIMLFLSTTYPNYVWADGVDDFNDVGIYYHKDKTLRKEAEKIMLSSFEMPGVSENVHQIFLQ